MPIYSTRAALNTSRAVLHMAVQFSDIALQTASLMHIYTIFTTSLMHFFTWDFLRSFFWFHRYVYFLLNCAHTAIYYTSTTTSTTSTTCTTSTTTTTTTTSTTSTTSTTTSNITTTTTATATATTTIKCINLKKTPKISNLENRGTIRAR